MSGQCEEEEPIQVNITPLHHRSDSACQIRLRTAFAHRAAVIRGQESERAPLSLLSEFEEHYYVLEGRMTLIKLLENEMYTVQLVNLIAFIYTSTNSLEDN